MIRNHQQYPVSTCFPTRFCPGTDVQQGCTCNAGFEGVITAAPSGNPKVFIFFKHREISSQKTNIIFFAHGKFDAWKRNRFLGGILKGPCSRANMLASGEANLKSFHILRVFECFAVVSKRPFPPRNMSHVFF